MTEPSTFGVTNWHLIRDTEREETHRGHDPGCDWSSGAGCAIDLPIIPVCLAPFEHDGLQTTRNVVLRATAGWVRTMGKNDSPALPNERTFRSL